MTHIATTLIESNYTASEEDHYIAVDCKKPVTIVLPASPKDGKLIIVKSIMKPPMGNRQITITTRDGSPIDGYSNYTIQVSNDFVNLIYHVNGWYVI